MPLTGIDAVCKETMQHIRMRCYWRNGNTYQCEISVTTAYRRYETGVNV